MRAVVSLVLVLSIIAGWSQPAAAERVSQEPPRVAPLQTTPPSSSTPPSSLPYAPGQPVPEGYHLVRKSRTGLIVTGAVTFGVAYGFSAGVGFLAGFIDNALTDGQGDDRWLTLAIPVAGPMVFGAVFDKDPFHPVLIADTLLQAGGIALLAYGASTKSTVLVRDGAAIRGIGPMPVAGGSGLVLSGTF